MAGPQPRGCPRQRLCWEPSTGVGGSLLDGNTHTHTMPRVLQRDDLPERTGDPAGLGYSRRT